MPTHIHQSGLIRRFAWSPDGERVVTCGDAGVVVWEAHHGARLVGLDAGLEPAWREDRAVSWLGFDRHGYVHLGRWDGAAVILDWKTGEALWAAEALEKPQRTEPRDVVWSHLEDSGGVWLARFDGRMVYFEDSGLETHVWDIRPDARTIDIYQVGVLGATRGPEGIFAAHADGVVHIPSHATPLEACRHHALALDDVCNGLERVGASKLVVASGSGVLLDIRSGAHLSFGEDVRGFALSSDHRRVAFVGARVTVVEVETGDAVFEAKSHAGGARAVVWEERERGWLVGGEDGRVVRLSAEGRVLGVVAEHPTAVSGLGPRGASISGDGTVCWPSRTPRRPARVPQLPPAVRLETGGQALWNAHPYGAPDDAVGFGVLMSQERGTTHWRWDGSSAQRLGYSNTTGGAAVSPDGSRALVSSNARLVCLEGDGLRERVLHKAWNIHPRWLSARHAAVSFAKRGGVMDVDTGELLFDAGPHGGGVVGGHLVYGPKGAWHIRSRPGGALDCVRIGKLSGHISWAVSRDGGSVSVRHNARVELWRLDPHDQPRRVYVREDVMGLTYTVSAGPGRWLWVGRDAAGDAFAQVLTEEGDARTSLALPHRANVHQVAASPGGHLALSLGDRGVWVFRRDAEGGYTGPCEMGVAWEQALSLRWLNEERLLVGTRGLMASDGAHVAVLEPEVPGDAEATSPLHPFVLPLFEERMMVQASATTGRLRWWRLEDGALLAEAPQMQGSLRALRLTPDGHHLLAVDSAGALWAWSVAEMSMSVVGQT